MNERTTLYLNRNLVDYLILEGENISRTVNGLLADFCLSKGYLVDTEGEIQKLRNRISTLQRIKSKQEKADVTEKAFLYLFRSYLTNGERSIHNIRNWLTGPGNRSYGSIIGHPKDLTKERIESLVTKALTVEKTEGELTNA